MQAVTSTTGVVFPHAPHVEPPVRLASVVRRWARRDAPTPAGLQQLGRRLVRLDAGDTELALVASRVMWQHRGQRLPTAPEVAAATGADRSPVSRFVYYCVLRHASYLFDMSTCLDLAIDAHVRWPGDRLVTALLGMAELADGRREGHRRITRLLRTCDEPKIRHIALTAYVISPEDDAPLHVVDLARRMRRDGQGDAIVDYREAVALRRLGDLPGATAALDRALHDLAVGPYDTATREFVNEQLRQERERIVDRIDRYGRTGSLSRTTSYGDGEATRGHDVDGSGHLKVTIHDEGGEPLATGVLSPTPRGRGARPGAARGQLRAPLWSLSLGSTVTVQLPDGSQRRVRIREMTSMDGPVATVNVDLTDTGHRAARVPSPEETSPTRPSPA